MLPIAHRKSTETPITPQVPISTANSTINCAIINDDAMYLASSLLPTGFVQQQKLSKLIYINIYLFVYLVVYQKWHGLKYCVRSN